MLSAFIMEVYLHHSSSFKPLYVITMSHLVFYKLGDSQKSILVGICHLVGIRTAIYSF